MKVATLETTKGYIKFKLYTEDAPITSQNFIDLAESGFYNGLIFHRYVEGFVIQGGDPTGTGCGGSDKTIPLEVSKKLSHGKEAGAVAMARSMHPDSASSQFYITLGDCRGLDMQYAVFGRVIEGIDVVMSLRQGDIMNTVTISEVE